MMLILICTTDITCPCIELFFEDVQEMYFSSRCGLNPTATFLNDRISFSFQGGETSDMQSKFLYYRILEKKFFRL
jgi:hypothetical protein